MEEQHVNIPFHITAPKQYLRRTWEMQLLFARKDLMFFINSALNVWLLYLEVCYKQKGII